MAEEEARKSPAKDLAEGLRSILERIADFFDIFDLSFVVSGAVTLSALIFCCWRLGVVIPEIHEGWLKAIAYVMASYVLGLVCFAIGRWPHRYFRWGRTEGGKRDIFLSILEAHGLSDKPRFAEYLKRTSARGEARLYVRLWAEVRQSPEFAGSLTLLRRYWVMAATYDGLVIALAVWAIVIGAAALGLEGSPPIGPWISLVILLTLGISIVACWREASRYIEFQIEELVASIAARCEELAPRNTRGTAVLEL